MKPLDQKDKPKLFALIGLSVVVLGFGIYQVTAGMAGAQAPAPAKDAKPSPAPEAAAKAEQEKQQAALVANLPTVPSPLGGRDPFIPQIALPGNTPPPPTKVATKTDTVPLPSLNGGGPGIGGVKIEWDKLGGAPAPAPSPKPTVVQLPPPPPPTLAVAGVLVAGPGSGNKDIAVLRGGSDRRYVTLGDPVGNGFVVSAIRIDGVEIMEERHTSRRFTFKTSK